MQLDKLIEEYNRITNDIVDACDWKTHFSAEEIISIVLNIYIDNGYKLDIDKDLFLIEYLAECEKHKTNDKNTLIEIINNLINQQYLLKK